MDLILYAKLLNFLIWKVCENVDKDINEWKTRISEIGGIRKIWKEKWSMERSRATWVVKEYPGQGVVGKFTRPGILYPWARHTKGEILISYGAIRFYGFYN